MNEESREQYFTTLPSLFKKFDKQSRRMGFKANDIEEFNLWKKTLREKLTDITGINSLEICELNPRLLESVQFEGYRRDKVVIQTEENVWMPFYILVPYVLKEGQKTPAIIAAHGHLGGGKESIAGRMDMPGIKNAVERYNYDYGVQLVKEGYIVFCPDARGFGERREYWLQGNEEQRFLNSCCNHLNNVAISMGLSLTGLTTWDLMRLIDYIETYELCDSSRIGCCGFSGGGLQTLWLAAMDDRIKCAVTSGYFYGSKDALLDLTNCGCNYVPHLWEYADMGDLGALIAPRPFLIENGNEDKLNGKRGIENVLEQLNVTKEAYRLFNSENKLDNYVGEGGHYWYEGKTSSFFKNNL